jgi:hypothetical protein
MWVEWSERHTALSKKRDKSQIREGEVGTLFIAKLCESGKSKRYLGSIRRELLHDAFAQVEFWRGVQGKMREYELSDAEKWTVDKKLRERVPKPETHIVKQVDYILAHKDEYDAMPDDVKRASSVETVADIIRKIEAGEGFEVAIPIDSEREKIYRIKSMEEKIREVKLAFDVLIKGTKGKEQEVFLQMYREIEGREWAAPGE